MIRVLSLPDDAEILHQVSLPVTIFGAAVTKLVESMDEARRSHSQGSVGLAAIQIGIPLRVVLIEYNGERLELVNPVITRQLARTGRDKEGCLSVPRNMWREVDRAMKCDIAYQDVNGEQQTKSCSGMLARIVQHELDHLEGVLLTDK